MLSFLKLIQTLPIKKMKQRICIDNLVMVVFKTGKLNKEVRTIFHSWHYDCNDLNYTIVMKDEFYMDEISKYIWYIQWHTQNKSPWHKWKIYHDIHRRFTITYREDSPWHTQKIYHDIHIRFTMTYKEDFSWHRKKIYYDIHVVKRSMPLMEQDLRLCVSLFVPLSFFFWPLHCSSIFDLQLLITPLVSSTFSYWFSVIISRK